MFSYHEIVTAKITTKPTQKCGTNNQRTLSLCNILTSDPAELSDEKCTCVNNTCIRSKLSGDNLDCRRVELSANCDATGSRLTSNNYITRVRQEVNQLEIRVWNQLFQFEEWEPAPSRDWVPRPLVKQVRRTGKKCCYSQKSGGRYVAVCVQSPTHLSHIPFCNPFVTLL